MYIWYDLEQAIKRLYRTSSTEKGALMEGAYLVELDFRKAATDKKIMPINCADFRSEESRQEYFQNCYVDGRPLAARPKSRVAVAIQAIKETSASRSKSQPAKSDSMRPRSGLQGKAVN